MSRATRLLFYRITPYLVSKIADCWLVGVVCWGGVLCENCIVDANAIIINGNNIVVVCFSFLWFCSWYFLLSVREMFVFFVFRAHGGCLGMLSR